LSEIPQVSVVLPVWDGEAFLAEAIESILGQTFQSLELILVDDGSSDGSLRIAEEYAARDGRVRVLRQQERGGYARAINAGIHAARGQFIARMDGDDVAHADRLRQQVDYLQANPGCVAVGSAIEAIDATGSSIGVTYFAAGHEKIVSELLRGTTSLSHPTVVARRDALIAAGGYDPKLYPSEDLALWLAMGELGHLANLRQPLLRYRRHEAAVGVRDRAAQMAMTVAIVNPARLARGLEPLRNSLMSPGRVKRARYHFDCARFALVGGSRRVAMRHAARSIASDPRWLEPYVALVASLLPRWALRAGLEMHARYRAARMQG
jgi:glycosyltransferase involved in cell wall biosynthesis